MRPRDLFHWKTYFYHGLLPALRRLGPERADALLARLATAAHAGPGRAERLVEALQRSGAPEPANVSPAALAAGAVRFIARDYLLETDNDATALARFDVTGAEAFDAALAARRGIILVGGHFGAHLASFHWFYRRNVPFRVMVQRPRHVSRALSQFFDRSDPDPPSAYFLRRGLGPADCVERLLRVRSAVRAGKVVYFAGDIPWTGPNTRAGRLLGQSHPFLSVWADLSALTGAPVFFTHCTHKSGGRFGLALEPYGPVASGAEDVAVSAFLRRLERLIATHPGDAPAHLLWPCYGPPATEATERRPSRRAAAVAWDHA